MGESQDQFNKLKERANEAQLVRKIVFIIVIALAIIIIGGITFIFYYIHHSLAPVSSSSDKKIVVAIPSGTSVEGIGDLLESKGLIHSSPVFRYYAKYKNQTDFKAGIYQFSPSMSVKDVIQKMENGDVDRQAALTVVIPEGFTVSQITERIAKKTGMSTKAIHDKLTNRDYIKTHYMKKYPFLKDAILDKKIKSPLEGYLFPATYGYDKKKPNLDTIIDKMLDKTQTILNKYQKQINTNSLGSVHKILTMASIVEREASQPEDRQKVAGVFYNRINKGMPLQSDITVLYALGSSKQKVTYKDTEVSSPYNTYHQKGLPIGPINNPSEASISAVLNPADISDLYFYARPNGKIIYTKTLAEHDKVVNKYKHEWDNVKKEE
ncbi:hypothetical protein GCM10011391_22350 [Pullulanibacillus camelliae]|uniref:Endolytic murein transglycosylase n=1 Tax=Pullulanibacillus camelliae TaxID=1707096 RepID=A0A8J3DUL3_9BACL|nr:endolytic transglycosylase MltG [Pullulanibacillus camelliae]GGE43067.1 hypothetical protein GCM10011391_22350 [Pullulanibacillus camelliae]